MMDQTNVLRRMNATLAQEIGQKVLELHELRALVDEAQDALRRAVQPAEKDAAPPQRQE